MQELLSRLLDELRNAWRFRWWALVVAWVIAIAGWLFVYSMPNQYEVKARVHIDTKSAINPLLRGLAVLPDVDEQVDLLVQTVLSRPNLKDIARRTGLDIKADTPRAEEKLLDRLAGRIKIRNGGYNINLYSISFTSSDADTARAVVQQVINIMTSMALAEQGGDSRQAMNFLKKEVASYKDQVEDLGHKISAFEKQHPSVVPGQVSYGTRVQTLQDDLAGLKDQLTLAQEQQSQLKHQVASGGGSRTVSPEQSQQVRQIDGRIEQAERKLQQMLGRYTAEYPDVVSLRRQIARMKSERSDTIAALRANPERVSVGSGAASSARSQLASVQTEISTLKRKIARKQGRIESLTEGAGEMTEAQSEYAKMQRKYKSVSDQYAKLRARMYSAELSKQAQSSGSGMKFNIIDPPEKPQEPTGPDRPILITLALFASLAAGGVFAFFMSQIRPVFINRRSLTDFTGLPVLGSVSLATSMRENVQRKTALALFLVGVGTLVLGYAGALALAPIGSHMVPVVLSNNWL